MRTTRAFALYLVAILGFGVVVLWADRASQIAFLAFVVAVIVSIASLLLLARRRRRVLVVGTEDADVERLERTLETRGYLVCTCSGPDDRPCPVGAGRPCPAPGFPLAALIIRNASSGAFPACGEALDIPEVTVEERIAIATTFEGPTARTSLEDGPDAVVDVMEQLLLRA